MRGYIISFACAAILGLSGCANQYSQDDTVSLAQFSSQMATRLITNLNETKGRHYVTDVSKTVTAKDHSLLNQPIVATSFANIDNLEESSTIGRMLSEHIASELSKHNLAVSDIRLMSNQLIVRKQSGEFVLTRDLSRISKAVPDAVILTGTYASLGFDTYSVSVRLVRNDGLVIASCNGTWIHKRPMR